MKKLIFLRYQNKVVQIGSKVFVSNSEVPSDPKNIDVDNDPTIKVEPYSSSLR